MSYTIIRHSVEDYSRWKPVFDEHDSDRRAAGCQGGLMFRDAANPNDITIVLEWADIDRAKSFMQSPILREAMTRGGVNAAPSVQFVEKLADLGS